MGFHEPSRAVTMSLPQPVGRQVDVLYLAPEGHNVVLGTAGSGKTTMAIHRAVHLANPAVPGNGRTLLLTFNKALVIYLRHLSPAGVPNLTIEHYHQFARGYLAHRGLMGWNQILDSKDVLLAEALDQVKRSSDPSAVLDRPITFFSDEIQWMAGNGLFRLADYLDAARYGRSAPLQPSQRRLVFQVAETYRSLRAAAHRRYDWDDLAAAVRAELEADTDPRRYKHIVIDEGQDFSPEMIRSLVLAADPEGSVTFFGDYAQQIYGQRMSWKSFGLKVHDVYEFKENYATPQRSPVWRLPWQRCHISGTPRISSRPTIRPRPVPSQPWSAAPAGEPRSTSSWRRPIPCGGPTRWLSSSEIAPTSV